MPAPGGYMIRNLRSLIGLPVSAVDGDIGTIRGFYFDDTKWMIRYIAVETGKLAHARDVLLSPASVVESGLVSGKFKVNLTRDQVDGSPEVDLGEPVARQLEEKISAYYRWPRYWETSPRVVGERPAGAPEAAKKPGVPGVTVAEQVFTYNLVSSRRFFGSLAVSRDGKSGTIDDCTADDDAWDIRGVVIDPGIPLAGKKVVIPPRSVTAVDPSSRQVTVNMTRSEINGAPEFK